MPRNSSTIPPLGNARERTGAPGMPALGMLGRFGDQKKTGLEPETFRNGEILGEIRPGAQVSAEQL